MQLLQQAVEVSRPAGGHRRRAKGVLQAQVPADDPGHQFAQRRIAVGVSRSGNGNDGGKLRIAEAGEGAGDSGQHKAQRHGRAGVQRRRLAGQHKDAGADDGANAERDQVERAERALERVFALFTGLLREHRHGFDTKQSGHE